MSAYTLRVLHNGKVVPTEIAYCERVSQINGLIRKLLKAHLDCHSIWVRAGLAHLFTVDCQGDVTAY